MKGYFPWNPDIISSQLTLGKNIEVWNKTDGNCCYCGEKTLKLYQNRKENKRNPLKATIEHIKPRSHGGTNALENLVIACGKCNGARGNMKLKTFRKHFGVEFYYDFGSNEPRKTTNCPNCGTTLSRSLQPRAVKQEDGSTKRMMRPYPDGYLSCPGCPRVVNTNTNEVYYNGKLEK